MLCSATYTALSSQGSTWDKLCSLVKPERCTVLSRTHTKILSELLILSKRHRRSYFLSIVAAISVGDVEVEVEEIEDVLGMRLCLVSAHMLVLKC